MKTGEWTLRSHRVVTPSGTRGADVLIRGESIYTLLEYDDSRSEGVILDAGDLVVLPGLVAFQRDRRGFEEITRDAAAGGVTTLIDLPSDHGPSSDRSGSFKTRMERAEGKIRVDCGLVAGLGRGDSKLLEGWIESGVVAIEASLESIFSGPEDSSMRADFREICSILARLDRPIMVHPEETGPEYEAVCRLIKICRETRCRVHLVHPKSSTVLPIIAEARAEGLPLTVETSASRLCLSNEPMAESALSDTRRSVEPSDWLWEGLRAQTIGSIGLDAVRRLSSSMDSAQENTSLKLGLPVVWAEARRRGFTLDDLSRWMASHPARTLGLAHRKGSIDVGLDADLVIFDPDSTKQGREPAGRIEATILRGTMIFQDGRYHELPTGAVVLRLEETLPIHHLTP